MGFDDYTARVNRQIQKENIRANQGIDIQNVNIKPINPDKVLKYKTGSAHVGWLEEARDTRGRTNLGKGKTK